MAVSLRPHHGMCFQFYEGKGYNADFTDHMGKIIRRLTDAPCQPVTLRASADVVCENCPNLREGVCADGEKVRRYDEAVLRLCGLRDGDTVPYADFLAAVREHVISAGLRGKICGDCCWNTICSNKEKAFR